MDAFLAALFVIAAASFVACFVWLHWRALKDGVIQDVLLFLTGITTLSYIFGRWDRAKWPVLCMLGILLSIGIVSIEEKEIREATHELSAEIKKRSMR